MQKGDASKMLAPQTMKNVAEKSTEKSRIVAIVGRPNVGKSALFNRLAGRRISIVHEQSGVTRDRIMCEVMWDDRKFELIDTGGINNIDNEVRHDRIEDATYGQVDAAVSDAAVAILVVDVVSGLVPLDEAVANHIRRSGCKVFVAANKCDDAAKDEDTIEFERFGFPVFPVSALHNRGIGELMENVVEALPTAENVTVSNPLKVVVVGRPNVGKSSYINRLLRSDRVIVSDIPGTTRDSIDIPFVVGKGDQAGHYLLIDTAGIRRTGKIDNAVERFSRFRAEESIARADVAVLVLDAIAGPTAQDKKIASMIIEKNKGCVILVNKWDLEQTTQAKYGPALHRVMPFVGHCPVVFSSALSGYNIRKSIDAIDYVADQIQAELPTGMLNSTIMDACKKTQPAAVGGRRLKIFYCTQVGRAPIRIRVFVNDPLRVQENYKTYLVRMLRSRFGLEGAPVLLQFRARR